MLGLMYKDFLVMKKELGINALVCFAYMLFMTIAFYSLTDGVATFLLVVELIVHLFIFTVLGGLQNSLFEGDENVYYSSFVISTPLTVKGQIRSKYCEILILAFAGIIIGKLGDLLATVVLGEDISMRKIYMAFFFVQLFLRAFDIPFIVRFGTKYGKNVKMVMVAIVAFALLVYGLFGPLPSGGIQGAFDVLVEWFMTGENLSAAKRVVTSVFPYVAVAAFYISYRVSCKMYINGVANYE